MIRKTNKIKLFSFSIYKWFWIILNIILLSLAIYFFILGPKLNIGGLDGLSLLTIQFLHFFCKDEFIKKEIFLIIFIFFYNIISLIVSYKFFGKEFCLKILFLVLFFNGFFFILNQIIGYDKRQSILSKIFFQQTNDSIISLSISSILSGILIGYTLSNIRNLDYNTGGMDIFHKICKDIYNINYIWTLLLTDGVIILLFSLLESKRDLIYFFIRIFFSFLTLIIIGIIMEKTYIRKNNFIKKI